VESEPLGRPPHLKPWIHIAALLVVLGAPFGPAFGSEQRFPPPDFGPEYSLPRSQYPEPRADVCEYLDIAVLLAALSAASYLALRARSRRAMFVLMALSLFYFGFWRKGCVCPIGAIQNVTLAAFDRSYAVPLVVVAFFSLPLAFTLFFGRSFCAAVCPLGALQDFVLLHPVKVPGWLAHALRVLAYVYLGAAILFTATGSAFLICQYDPFVPLFRRSGSVSMLTLGACFLVIGLFVGRPYCRFLCPYGVILGLVSRVSQWRVKITPELCVRCRLCEDTCPVGAIQKPAEEPMVRERARARGRLAALIALLPVLIVLGGWGVSRLATPFSRMHAAVRLAERVRAEDASKVEGDADASRAFRGTGRPTEELYAEALGLRGHFALGGRLLGGFIGLVIGVKLVHLSIRRRRPDYEADRGACLACGRCFDYCPVEHQRRRKMTNDE